MLLSFPSLFFLGFPRKLQFLTLPGFFVCRWCLFLGKILGFLLFNLLASHPYFILLSFNIYIFLFFSFDWDWQWRISIPKFTSGFSCSSCSLSSVHIFCAAAKKKTFSQLQWRKKSKRPCIMLLKGLWRSGGMAQISIQTLVVGLQYRYYQ